MTGHEPSGASGTPRPWGRGLARGIDAFQRIMVGALLIMMMATIVISAVGLGWSIVKETLQSARLIFDVKQVMEMFGLVFTVLIGLELLETIKSYVSQDQLHVEVVFLVAMVAVARKVIILEVKESDPVVLLGIAAIILALAVGFYYVKRAQVKDPNVPAPKK